MSIVKEEAKKLIDKLPEYATWDDIMYELYVKKIAQLFSLRPFLCPRYSIVNTTNITNRQPNRNHRPG